MIKRILVLVVFALGLSGMLFSQSDFRNAYILQLNGDTLYGLVDYRGDIRNSKQCVFKSNLQATARIYEANEIRAYRFSDSKYYVSKRIMIEDEPEYVFLEFLVNGVVDLFYNRDTEGDHYWLESEEGELFELTNEQIAVYVPGFGKSQRDSNKHIGLLKTTFADCNEIQDDLNYARLNHKSLMKLTKQYHDFVCTDEQCVIYEKPSPDVKVAFTPMIGVESSFLDFSRFTYYQYVEFGASINPSFGLKLDLCLPKVNEKVFFQVDAFLSKSVFNGTYDRINITIPEYYQVNIKSTLLQTSAGFKYKYPKGKLRPVMGIGASIYNFYRVDAITTLVEQKGTVVISEFNDVPLASQLAGAYFEIGSDFELSEKHSLYFCLRYSYVQGTHWKTLSTLHTTKLTAGYNF